MLQVTPVREKELQEAYCTRLGLPYDIDEMCYAAYDDETPGDGLVGISLFRLLDGYCVIYQLKLFDGVEDQLARLLLGKAPMNFADRCGVHKAIYKAPDKDLARELEFLEKDGVWTLDLEGYFTSPCQRHHDEH